MTGAPVLGVSVRGLTVGYGARPVLDGLDLEVDSGALAAVLVGFLSGYF